MPKVYGFTEYGGPDVQEFWDQPRPSPGPGELLVAVKAAGVNPVDWKIREGHLAEWMPRDLPAVLGREVSGVVEEVGQDVEGFAVGDEVFGVTAPTSGGYAEYTLLTAAGSAKKPVKVSFVDAATLPVAAATAYDAITQLALEPGSILLVNGAGGGVGVVAAQLARDAGVTVVGTGGDGKRELVESLGATFVDYREDVAAQVRQILPDGVDAVLDTVGGDALRAVAPLVKDPSRVVSTNDQQTAEELGGAIVERDGTGAVLSEVASLVADGKLDMHVVDVRPLDEAAQALSGVESGHSRGKVVLEL
jgi:NADPH2:quinone reductase